MFKNVRALVAASFFAFAAGGTHVPAIANAGDATVRTATDSIACVANASSPIIFYGQLPQMRYLDQQPSIIEIYPTTDLSEFTFESLSNRLHGVNPTSPPGGGMAYQKHRLDMTIASIGMQSSVSHAFVSRKGSWACRGFSPGKYSFLATLHVLGKSASSGDQDTIVTQYYRADIVAPETNKAMVTIPVTRFTLIGQTPQ